MPGFALPRSPASSGAGPAANRQARSRDSSRGPGRLVYQPPGHPIRLPENAPIAAADRRARKIPAFWCCRTTPQRPLPLAVFYSIRAAGPKCRALPPPKPGFFRCGPGCESPSAKPGFFARPGRLVYQPPGHPIRLPENIPIAAADRRARKIPAFWCCRTTPQRPLPLAVFYTIRAAGPKCRALPSPEARLLPVRARLRIAKREAGILRAARAGWCTNRPDTRYACLRTFPSPRLTGVPEKSRHSGAAARHRNDRCHWRSSTPSGPPVPNAGLCPPPKPGFFRRGPGCESPSREAGILRAARAGWCTNRPDTRYACLRTLPSPRLTGVPEKSRHSGAAARHRNDRCHWRSSTPSGPPVPNAGLCPPPKPGFFRRGPGCESPSAKPGFFARPGPAGVPTARTPDTPA